MITKECLSNDHEGCEACEDLTNDCACDCHDDDRAENDARQVGLGDEIRQSLECSW